MRGKKGQFYLLSAIILITLIVGFVTVSNYSSAKPSVKLYDLGEELGIEAQNVIDYGTQTYGENEAEMNDFLEGFIQDYVDYAGDKKNLYFVFGDPDGVEGLKIVAYENLALVDAPPMTTSGVIVISLDTTDYQFSLEEGQNFYFIISQEIEGEKYVVTG